MQTSLPKNVVPRTATDVGGLGAPWQHGDQAEMFRPARPSWREWIRWLFRSEFKSIGVRCFGGDPEQARIAMTKVLESKTGRRFDIQWLDYIAEELGPPGEEAIVRFVCDRYGFQMAQRLPSPEREEARIAHLDDTITQLADAAAAAARELAELRGDREKER